MLACSHVRTAGCPPAPGLIHLGAAKQAAGSPLERASATERPTWTRRERRRSREKRGEPAEQGPEDGAGREKPDCAQMFTV
jgi:hypothetical protein